MIHPVLSLENKSIFIKKGSRKNFIPPWRFFLYFYINHILIPVDTGRKVNVHKTFRRYPGSLLNVLCTFILRPVSAGTEIIYRDKASKLIKLNTNIIYHLRLVCTLSLRASNKNLFDQLSDKLKILHYMVHFPRAVSLNWSLWLKLLWIDLSTSQGLGLTLCLLRVSLHSHWPLKDLNSVLL